MATIFEAYKMWSAINSDEIALETIKENENIVISAQVDQMRHGIASDGKYIGEYSKSIQGQAYAAYKDEKGLQDPAPYGFVNLYNTGDFTKGINLDYSNDYALPYSTDSKEKTLLQKYSEKIYGLSEKWMYKIINSHLRKSYQKILRKRVQL